MSTSKVLCWFYTYQPIPVSRLNEQNAVEKKTIPAVNGMVIIKEFNANDIWFFYSPTNLGHQIDPSNNTVMNVYDNDTPIIDFIKENDVNTFRQQINAGTYPQSVFLQDYTRENLERFLVDNLIIDINSITPPP